MLKYFSTNAKTGRKEVRIMTSSISHKIGIIQLYHRKKADGSYSQIWYARWPIISFDKEGNEIPNTKRVSLNTEDENEAIEWALNNKNIVSSGYDESTLQVKDIRFEDFIKIYLDCTQNRHSKGHRANIEYMLRSRLSPFFKNAVIRQIFPENIHKLFAQLKKKGLENATINRYHQVLSSMFTEAIQLGFATSNPLNKIKKLPESDKRKEFNYLDKVEIEKLLNACSDEFYPIAAVAIFTGMRKGELCGLKWSDIDFNENLIFVKRSYTENTKGKATRIVPMTSDVKEVLLNQRKILAFKSNYVFPLSDGSMRKGNISKPYKNALKQAGISKKITFHGLRDTFATLFLSDGGTLEYLQEILGHRSKETTMRYSHLAKQYDAIKKQMPSINISKYSKVM